MSSSIIITIIIVVVLIIVYGNEQANMMGFLPNPHPLLSNTPLGGPYKAPITK